MLHTDTFRYSVLGNFLHLISKLFTEILDAMWKLNVWQPSNSSPFKNSNYLNTLLARCYTTIMFGRVSYVRRRLRRERFSVYPFTSFTFCTVTGSYILRLNESRYLCFFYTRVTCYDYLALPVLKWHICVGCQIVQYSTGGLKINCFSSKCLVFKWLAKSRDNHLNMDTHAVRYSNESCV